MEPSPTGSAPSKGFRALAYLTAALTFVLIVVGGVVRISDSGLGCGPAGSGTEGWPLCGGRLIPLIDTNMIVEYAHRLLAGSVAVLIATLALLAWRHYRARRWLVRLSAGALGLVAFQAALGGLTVEKGLKEELVAAHLGTAMLQLGLLILVAYLARAAADGIPGSLQVLAASPGTPSASGGHGVRLLAVVASVAVLATIVAGGYMSASELRGTGALGVGARSACGNEFPTCNGGLLPFGTSRGTDIQLTHRTLMYLASALVLALFLAALRQDNRRIRRAAVASLAALAVQVLLGALNVWLGEHAWLVVAHLAGATLLWSSLVYVLMLVLRPQQHAAVRAGATGDGRRALADRSLAAAGSVPSDAASSAQGGGHLPAAPPPRRQPSVRGHTAATGKP